MPITSTNQQTVLSAAAPGNSAIGDAAAAGTSAAIARADHKHGREASGTPGASAVGDTASTGSATTVALSDHRHSREAFGTPVNLDATVTSLSAGSLTTVARADHIHTLSKVAVLLGSTTLGSATSSVTFSSINQSFSELEIRVIGNTAYTGNYSAYPFLRVNSLSTSIYYCGYRNSLQTELQNVQIATGNFFNDMFNHTSWRISAYATSKYKSARIEYFSNFSSTAFSPSWNYAHGVIATTSAITSVTVHAQSTLNFSSGSMFLLYGIPL